MATLDPQLLQAIGAALTGMNPDEVFAGRNPLVPRAPNIFETRPLASSGDRSIVELNNPELGPTDVELRRRKGAR